MEEKKKKPGISLMASEIEEEIKSINGFCTKKFKADIKTKGIDYKNLHENDLLEINGKKIRITKVGKPCFSDCPYEHKPCILNRNVAFGEEVKNEQSNQ